MLRAVNLIIYRVQTNVESHGLSGDAVTSSPITQEGRTNDSAPHADHLSTGHLLDNMRGRAVSGGFVTIGAQMAKFVLNFASAAVLARLLTPKEFGLVGMVLGVTGLVGIFKE